RPVRGDAGPGGDQQVAPVVVLRHEAEAPERPAGLDAVPHLQPLEQRGGRAARNEADRDLDQRVRFTALLEHGRQRIAALGLGAIGVLEVHLDELPRQELQRLAVVAAEHVMADARRQGAPGLELQGKTRDRQGGGLQAWRGEACGGAEYCVPWAAAASPLYYRGPCGARV